MKAAARRIISGLRQKVPQILKASTINNPLLRPVFPLNPVHPSLHVPSMPRLH
jgi:hypothetical protein